MNIAVLLGAPGTGKGTQAKRLLQAGFTHYSTGDILRQAIKEGSKLGATAKAFIDKGELVPDDIMIEIIEHKLSGLSDNAKVLLDGFPRTVPQAEALDKKPLTQVKMAVNFQVPDDVLVERLTGRRTCKNCGAAYHIKFMPPQKEGVCDQCGSAELVQRTDDSKDVVKKRLDVFREKTAALIDYFDKKAVLTKLDANRSAEAVESDLLEMFEPWSK